MCGQECLWTAPCVAELKMKCFSALAPTARQFSLRAGRNSECLNCLNRGASMPSRPSWLRSYMDDLKRTTSEIKSRRCNQPVGTCGNSWIPGAPRASPKPLGLFRHGELKKPPLGSTGLLHTFTQPSVFERALSLQPIPIPTPSSQPSGFLMGFRV